MALNIRNPETEKLVDELARLADESKTEAVTNAVKARLQRLKSRHRYRLADRLDEIAKHCAALPVLDRRTPEEMLYDERGLPRQ
jgi:antitoxin VapB